MKQSNPVDLIINRILDNLGARHLPPGTRELIAADLIAELDALATKRMSTEYIGRMVARALAQGAEGCKGDGTSPLPRLRTGDLPKSQGRIPRPGSKTLLPHDSTTGDDTTPPTPDNL